MIKTTKNLIAFLALAILLVSSHSVLAYDQYYNNNQGFNELPTWTPTQTHNSTSNGVVYNGYQQPVYNYPTQTNQASVNPVVTPTHVATTQAANTNSSANYNNTNGGVPNNQNQVSGSLYPSANNTDSTNNGLTALSLNGSGGFMPSSIWQWLLVILLILVIIIIARMISKKSSHHEVHPTH